MSYLDQSGKRNPASIAAVVGVHLAVGYALISGFAITVIKLVPRNPVVISVNDPPPPIAHREAQRARAPSADAQPEARTVDEKVAIEDPIFKASDRREFIGIGGSEGSFKIPPLEPSRSSQAADAVPGKDRLRWITTDDYPAAAIRQNVQGVVAISVTIGTDGHVRSCLVTQSSGSQLLDDATCRLYSRRAHFTPARDADGNATTAQRTDRYRWQIPGE